MPSSASSAGSEKRGDVFTGFIFDTLDKSWYQYSVDTIHPRNSRSHVLVLRAGFAFYRLGERGCVIVLQFTPWTPVITRTVAYKAVRLTGDPSRYTSPPTAHARQRQSVLKAYTAQCILYCSGFAL